jgi:hypothetical protein
VRAAERDADDLSGVAPAVSTDFSLTLTTAGFLITLA